SYFVEMLLSQLPSQVLPEKMHWMNVSTLLGRELLGKDADYGAGIAGAIVADGYMIGGPFGVAALAAVLGAITGCVMLLVRHPQPITGRVPLWRLALYACLLGQLFVLIRGDLGIVLSQFTYYVLLPWACVRILLLRWSTGSWHSGLEPVP